jgi:hypothetical protein
VESLTRNRVVVVREDDAARAWRNWQTRRV